MSGISKLTVTLAWALLLLSAVAVIWSKHQSRSLFVELQKLETERDRLDTEWGQLRLEQSTSATYGRIEKMAHDELGMIVPSPAAVRIIEPASE